MGVGRLFRLYFFGSLFQFFNRGCVFTQRSRLCRSTENHFDFGVFFAIFFWWVLVRTIVAQHKELFRFRKEWSRLAISSEFLYLYFTSIFVRTSTHWFPRNACPFYLKVYFQSSIAMHSMYAYWHRCLWLLWWLVVTFRTQVGWVGSPEGFATLHPDFFVNSILRFLMSKCPCQPRGTGSGS